MNKVVAHALTATSHALTRTSCAAGEWTEEHTTELLSKLDKNMDGQVSGAEFCKHFEQALPADNREFNSLMVQFFEAAALCRDRKQVCALFSLF